MASMGTMTGSAFFSNDPVKDLEGTRIWDLMTLLSRVGTVNGLLFRYEGKLMMSEKLFTEIIAQGYEQKWEEGSGWDRLD